MTYLKLILSALIIFVPYIPKEHALDWRLLIGWGVLKIAAVVAVCVLL